MNVDKMILKRIDFETGYRSYEINPAYIEKIDSLCSNLQFDDWHKIDFYQSCFCFTGCLFKKSITREKIMKATLYLGARVHNILTNEVNVLVVGSKKARGWTNQTYGNKIWSAVERRESRKDILIISEEQYWELFSKYEQLRGKNIPFHPNES